MSPGGHKLLCTKKEVGPFKREGPAFSGCCVLWALELGGPKGGGGALPGRLMPGAVTAGVSVRLETPELGLPAGLLVILRLARHSSSERRHPESSEDAVTVRGVISQGTDLGVVTSYSGFPESLLYPKLQTGPQGEKTSQNVTWAHAYSPGQILLAFQVGGGRGNGPRGVFGGQLVVVCGTEALGSVGLAWGLALPLMRQVPLTSRFS